MVLHPELLMCQIPNKFVAFEGWSKVADGALAIEKMILDDFDLHWEAAVRMVRLRGLKSYFNVAEPGTGKK